VDWKAVAAGRRAARVVAAAIALLAPGWRAQVGWRGVVALPNKL
jgi:hypothetical protein